MDQSIHFATAHSGFGKMFQSNGELCFACNRRKLVTDEDSTTTSTLKTTCVLCKKTNAYAVAAKRENRQRHYATNSDDRLYLSENMGQLKTFYGRLIKVNTKVTYGPRRKNQKSFVLLRDVLVKDLICGRLYIAQYIWLQVPINQLPPIPERNGPTSVLRVNGTPINYLKNSQEVDYEVSYLNSNFLDDAGRLKYYEWLHMAIKDIPEKEYLLDRVIASVRYLQKVVERQKKTG